MIGGTLSIAYGAGEMVRVGSHPTSILTPFPAIHVLKTFEGRIYMGYGDWNFSPASVVASYDPDTGGFHVEHSVGSDTVGNFRVVGGDLFVPSIDPVHFDEFTDFSVRSGGTWRRSAPFGFVHVFDVSTLTGDDVWAVGSKMVSETATANGAVWRTADRGETWQDMALATPLFRYYYCFALRGKLYVRDTIFDGTNATRIAAFPFETLYKPVTLAAAGNEIVVALAEQSPGIGSFNRMAMVRFDGTNWQQIAANIVDMTAVGSTLYALEYDGGSGSNQVRTFAYDGTSLFSSSTLPVSNVPGNAKSVEVLGDSLFVGDTAGGLWVGRVDGGAPVVPEASVINDLPDGFGRAMAIDASSLVIGAPEYSGSNAMSGQVIVWRRETPSDPWSDPQVLLPPHASFSGWFGMDVAIDGNVLAVVEGGADPGGLDRGISARVHLFERAAGAWQLRQTVTNAFAQSVALGSNTLWVAASKQLHRYGLSPGDGGLQALLIETISSDAPGALYEPASRVIVDGDRMVFSNVGDYSRGGGPGLVIIFEHVNGVWRRITNLVQNAAPLPPGLSFHPDAFGFALAMTDDWLAVGAPRDDAAGLQAGAVHLYQRVSAGTNVSYISRQKILPPTPETEGGFGSAVAFSGNTLVVGSPGASGRAGRAYAYRIGNTNLSLGGIIPKPIESLGEFGSAMVFDRTAILVGSRVAATNGWPLERILRRGIDEFVGPASDLSIMGTALPSRALPETLVTCTLIATNAGPMGATNVVIEFQAPTNGTVVGFSSAVGFATNIGGTITCLIPELAAGATGMLQVLVQPAFVVPCEIMRTQARVFSQGFDPHLEGNTVELGVNAAPPEIVITAPTNGASVRFGSTVELNGNVFASNGLVEVVFYTNGVLMGVDSNPPYGIVWTNVPAGTHAITVGAVDSCGLVTVSSPVTLVVLSNARPQVTITSPLHRTRFSETNGIRINVDAFDSDGAVAALELFQGAHLLKTFTSPPYSFVWNNASEGSWSLWARAIDNEGATNVSEPVLVIISERPPAARWVAFNDHGPGAGTHSNATTWNIIGDPPGPGGALKDISTGAQLPVHLSITRINPDNFSTGSARPNPGTPAAEVFDGYVEWLSGATPGNVRISAGGSVVYAFSGLDPFHRYGLKMTAVGSAFLPNRAILLQLNGTQSFRSSHTPGAPTLGFGTLASNEVVIVTGANVVGDLASWDDIQSAPDGTITVVCTLYAGPLPGGGSAGGPGHAVTAIRFENMSPSQPLITASAFSRTVAPGSTPTFSAEVSSLGALSYQWLRDNAPIAGATSAVLRLPPVSVHDAGRYALRVSDSNGHAMSKEAILTVLAMHPSRELEIAGPPGQTYQLDLRTAFDSPSDWTSWTNIVLPEPVFRIALPDTDQPQQFFRVIPYP